MTMLENRSLDRGISIMEALARSDASSLADLNRETGLAKSTLRRLLGTLIKRRIVRRSLSDKKYRINITLAAGSGEPVPAEMTSLVDVAMPHVIELTKRISWPSDVHLIDGNCMRIVDSTRPLSPFHLYRGTINRLLNIFGSATGNACLSQMTNETVGEYHRRTAEDPTWGLGRFNLSLAQYLQEISETRARGYGMRLSQYLGETVLDDG